MICSSFEEVIHMKNATLNKESRNICGFLCAQVSCSQSERYVVVEAGVWRCRLWLWCRRRWLCRLLCRLLGGLLRSGLLISGLRVTLWSTLLATIVATL